MFLIETTYILEQKQDNKPVNIFRERNDCVTL